jgi:hypothetical protein
MTSKDPTFQYAVKFVCGRADGEVLARGEYFTAVNAHNPTNKGIEFRKKFAIALPRQQPGPVSEFASTRLGPDEALEIDCADIRERTGSPTDLLKGFVIIESDVELDVVAVYTAAGADREVETLHIERVSPRRREVLPCPESLDISIDVGDCNPDGTRTVTFDSSISLAGPGTVQARWDFGDSTSGAPFSIPPVSHLETHNYAPGTYTATLQILPPADCRPFSFNIEVGQCPSEWPAPSAPRSTRVRYTGGG